MSEVDHPAHYGGGDNPYEAIKVIEAWDLGFNLGSALKYIARAGKKPGEELLVDLDKAAWYVRRETERIRNAMFHQQQAAPRGVPKPKQQGPTLTDGSLHKWKCQDEKCIGCV